MTDPGFRVTTSLPPGGKPGPKRNTHRQRLADGARMASPDKWVKVDPAAFGVSAHSLVASINRTYLNPNEKIVSHTRDGLLYLRIEER